MIYDVTSLLIHNVNESITAHPDSAVIPVRPIQSNLSEIAADKLEQISTSRPASGVQN